MQNTVDDLKIQLHQQQQAAGTAVEHLSAREAELQQLKNLSSTEAQAWAKQNGRAQSSKSSQSSIQLPAYAAFADACSFSLGALHL